MKILILDGDDLVQEINFKDKFVFVITDAETVYHIDSEVGSMHRANPGLKNLGKGHRAILKKHGVKK